MIEIIKEKKLLLLISLVSGISAVFIDQSRQELLTMKVSQDGEIEKIGLIDLAVDMLVRYAKLRRAISEALYGSCFEEQELNLACADWGFIVATAY